ncbi:hypothetical protein HBB16_03165 [Pseudonocardia sp. MCCB 268]|nr:hypothetical protein [Pseudonocardia cytotoxica]
MRAERGLTGQWSCCGCGSRGCPRCGQPACGWSTTSGPPPLAAVNAVEGAHAAWLAAPEQASACWTSSRGVPPAGRATGWPARGRHGDPARRRRRGSTGPTPHRAGRTHRRPAHRPPPLLVSGAPVPCSTVGQQRARARWPAPADGIAAPETVDGVHDPDTWPSRVFVYGVALMPRRSAWPLIRGHAAPHVLPLTGVPAVRSVTDTGQRLPRADPGRRRWRPRLRRRAGRPGRVATGAGPLRGAQYADPAGDRGRRGLLGVWTASRRRAPRRFPGAGRPAAGTAPDGTGRLRPHCGDGPGAGCEAVRRAALAASQARCSARPGISRPFSGPPSSR